MSKREPTQAEIDTLAASIADADDERRGSWPEFDGDDGRRGNWDEPGGSGYIAILSPEDQERYRAMARAAWFAMPSDVVAPKSVNLEFVTAALNEIASRAHAAAAKIQ